MHNLIITALKEARINRTKWLEATCSQCGSKCHRMLFRNAHIKNTVWHGLLHHVQTRAAWHGGCDTHNFWVILRLSQKTFAKDTRVTGRIGGGLLLNTS